MSPDGMALIGQMVSANVANASYTTDLLLRAKDDEIRRLAQALVGLDEVLARATVLDRKTERAISHFVGSFDHAADLLTRLEEDA